MMHETKSTGIQILIFFFFFISNCSEKSFFSKWTENFLINFISLELSREETFENRKTLFNSRKLWISGKILVVSKSTLRKGFFTEHFEIRKTEIGSTAYFIQYIENLTFVNFYYSDTLKCSSRRNEFTTEIHSGEQLNPLSIFQRLPTRRPFIFLCSIRRKYSPGIVFALVFCCLLFGEYRCLRYAPGVITNWNFSQMFRGESARWYVVHGSFIADINATFSHTCVLSLYRI